MRHLAPRVIFFFAGELRHRWPGSARRAGLIRSLYIFFQRSCLCRLSVISNPHVLMFAKKDNQQRTSCEKNKILIIYIRRHVHFPRPCVTHARFPSRLQPLLGRQAGAHSPLINIFLYLSVPLLYSTSFCQYARSGSR
jgi:hypothetical protein